MYNIKENNIACAVIDKILPLFIIDTTVDEQTQQNFITCLSSLRLLAKVLGLVVSLPYRSESNNFKELVATQVEVRSKVSSKRYSHHTSCIINYILIYRCTFI